MIFEVKVESREDYDAYLQSLVDAGQTSDKPVCGGRFVETQAGLDETTSDEDQEPCE